MWRSDSLKGNSIINAVVYNSVFLYEKYDESSMLFKQNMVCVANLLNGTLCNCIVRF